MALTHPDKLLWPDDGIRKADLARYLRAVAPAMLPHLRDRPLTLVRCPDGVGRGCFFQKHPDARPATGLRVVELAEVSGTGRYLVVRDALGLDALAQQSALELHVAGVRADRPRRPDRMVLDLDPAPDVPFARVMEAARELRRRLQRVGLPCFVMATGGKGLHVIVPLERRHDVAQVADFAAALAHEFAREQPDRYVAKASKAARAGRIFIDWLRNARGATAICPYSTRARPGAPVAVPLAWSELRAGLRPDAFSMQDAIARLAAGRDPWPGYEAARGRLPPGGEPINPPAPARPPRAPSRA